MRNSLMLEGLVVDDPLAFPAEADHVNLFVGAKPEVYTDSRVRDVRLTLADLQSHDEWLKAGMAYADMTPTDKQMLQARENTLDAIYRNGEVRGLHLACREEDASDLFESIDKTAAYLAATRGVPAPDTPNRVFLRHVKDRLVLQDNRGHIAAPTEGLSRCLREITALSVHFAVAARLIDPAAETAAAPYANAYFIPHVPAAMNSLFKLSSREHLRYQFNRRSGQGVLTLDLKDSESAAPRIIRFIAEPGRPKFAQSLVEIENGREETVYRGEMNYAVFASRIFAPLMRDAFHRLGEPATMASFSDHIDLFSLCRARALSREDFIESFIPPAIA